MPGFMLRRRSLFHVEQLSAFVNAGTISPVAFFSLENIGAIMAAARATT
jgi:hypothetical protein